MKKQTWLIASTALKTIYLTPVIVFMALEAFSFPNGGRYEHLKAISGMVTIIALLGLLTVFIVDIVRNKRNRNKKTGRLSCFLYLGIPVICLVIIAVAVFLLAVIYHGAELKYIFDELFFLGYPVGLLCLVVALVIDRVHKENRVTPDYLFYSLYFAIPVIWFIVLLFLSLLSAGFRLY